eukprot:TRINITY_DN9535_c0_g1_i11.p1 TRINITY_DN9535_c0_g1~~TRINITY_DN9535_c0_g1_i11.p1  ORF type:complete len:106 (+),score=12.22 TRINITY_DN9535_c0_g1_i11:734-1051(+)
MMIDDGTAGTKPSEPERRTTPPHLLSLHCCRVLSISSNLTKEKKKKEVIDNEEDDDDGARIYYKEDFFSSFFHFCVLLQGDLVKCGRGIPVICLYVFFLLFSFCQ